MTLEASKATKGHASLESQIEPFSLCRRLAAEALGTALLLAIVIGSGVMGERLSSGNIALALLSNTLATGAGLVVLITIFGPLSGAHFNPAVTLVFALRREIRWRTTAAYAAAQLMGAVLGVWSVHVMFAEPILQVSTKLRNGQSQIASEFIATFGLITAILGSLRFQPKATPMIVGLYITAAYWFTASTSFANPAATLARALSDTFAGIAPSSVSGFLIGQVTGAVAAAGLCHWLFTSERPS
jgi:glycerol uptake facilitator-like aquaporin